MPSVSIRIPVELNEKLKTHHNVSKVAVTAITKAMKTHVPTKKQQFIARTISIPTALLAELESVLGDTSMSKFISDALSAELSAEPIQEPIQLELSL